MTRDELLHELAHRSAVNGGQMVRGFAGKYGLTRGEYVDLVSDPEFERLLQKYTRAYVELPWHHDLHTRRVTAGLDGGLAALQNALTPPVNRITIEEKRTVSLEGSSDFFAAFQASLQRDGRSNLHPSADGDRPAADLGVPGEVLSVSAEGGSRVSARPSDSAGDGAFHAEDGVGAEAVRDLRLHSSQEAGDLPPQPLQGEVLPGEQPVLGEGEPDPDASGDGSDRGDDEGSPGPGD